VNQNRNRQPQQDGPRISQWKTQQGDTNTKN
jgi:hypothetical protein